MVGAGRAAGKWNCKTSQPRWAPWLWRRPSANSVGQRAAPFGRGSRVVAIAKGVHALVRGKLSKAQVVVYLLADTLGIEILEGEAMRLGENATKDAVAAKDGAQKLRNVVWDLAPPLSRGWRAPA